MPQVYTGLIPKASGINPSGILDARARTQLAKAAEQRAGEAQKVNTQSQLMRNMLAKQQEARMQQAAQQKQAAETQKALASGLVAIRQGAAKQGIEDPQKLAGGYMNVLNQLESTGYQIPPQLKQMAASPEGVQQLNMFADGLIKQATEKQAASGMSLDTGQKDARYYESPEGKVFTAFTDRKSGTDIIPNVGIVPKAFKDVTARERRRKYEQDASRELKQRRALNWEDARNENASEARNSISDITEHLAVVESAIDSLEGVATGAGGDLISTVNRVKNFFNIPTAPSGPEKAKEFLAAYQNKLISKYLDDQKGNLAKKEFEQVISAAPDITKTPAGNMMLLEMERHLGNWKRERDRKRRSLYTDPTIGPVEFDAAMDQWDEDYGPVIPKDLKRRVQREQADAKKLSYKDLYAVGTEQPNSEVTQEVGSSSASSRVAPNPREARAMSENSSNALDTIIQEANPQ